MGASADALAAIQQPLPRPPGSRQSAGRCEERVKENHVLQFARALDFAARKHIHQRRKGDLAEPYINHLSDVAWRLAEATNGEDATLVIAGLLHDTLEDTDTTFDELSKEFGREVAELVAEVSDDKTLAKAERKRRQVAETPGKSLRAKMIKLADKTSNLNSLLVSPPRDWSVGRKRDYFEWAQKVVDGCRGVNFPLEEAFDRTWQQGMQNLPS